MARKLRQMTDEMEIRVWVKRGIMMVNTEALDFDDPDHVYNQIKSQGKIPEDYGFYSPRHEEFKYKNRNELISEIVDLRKELNSVYRIMG